MSYVIQNFYDNKKIALTPRFRFFYILNNLEKFFIFFKLNTFFKFINIANNFKINYFSLFFRYFFTKQYIKIIYNVNLLFVGNYTNNLTKSFIFFIFFNLINFFKNGKIILNTQLFKKNFLFNLYLIPIKIINIKLNRLFYKNIFFYFMLVNSFLWYQHTFYFFFFYNFIFINYSLKTFRFFNNHFLRIYNV